MSVPQAEINVGGWGEVRVLQGRDLMTTVVPHARAGTLTLNNPRQVGRNLLKSTERRCLHQTNAVPECASKDHDQSSRQLTWDLIKTNQLEKLF